MTITRPALLPGLAAALLLASGAVAAGPLVPVVMKGGGGSAIHGLTPVFDARIGETLDLPTWELQQARRRMLADEQISWDDMRALADHGDGLAAFRFAQRIEGQGDPALLGDAAFYYATAAYTNRPYAAGPLIRILERRDVEFSPRRLEHMENALRALALSGDARSKVALTGFYASGHPFGRQPERALEFRLDLAEAGDSNTALALILEAMSGSSPLPLDEEQMTRLFDVVATSENLGLRTTGDNLRRMMDADSVQVRPVARATAEAIPVAEEAPP